MRICTLKYVIYTQNHRLNYIPKIKKNDKKVFCILIRKSCQFEAYKLLPSGVKFWNMVSRELNFQHSMLPAISWGILVRPERLHDFILESACYRCLKAETRYAISDFFKQYCCILYSQLFSIHFLFYDYLLFIYFSCFPLHIKFQSDLKNLKYI